MTLHEANCQIKFVGVDGGTTSFPTSGVTITNQGLGGSGYDGTATTGQNRYMVLPSQATAWHQIATNDRILVSHSTAPLINNPVAFTIEIGVILSGTGGSDQGTLVSKSDTGTGHGLRIYYYDNALYIRRYRTNGSYDQYNTTGGDWGTFTSGYYLIQISWDSTLTGAPNATCADPIVKFNGEVRSLLTSTTGTGTTWLDDSTYDLRIGNSAVSSYWFEGSIYLFKWHNTNLPDVPQ